MKPTPNILIGTPARRRLMAGAQLAARVVGATLGPGGKTVLVERSWAPPYATKDGVTVAREVALGDRHAHMGAMFALDASRRTVSAAGDGTTATVVLVGEMARAGELLRAAGHDPMALGRGMRRAGDELVSALRQAARPVDTTEDIRRVALLAANGDGTIADAVASALETVGVHGVVSIARSRRAEAMEVDVSSGLWFDRGWGSAGASMLRPDEMADGGGRACIERPLVLLLDDPMGDARGMVSLLEAALRVCKDTAAFGVHGGLIVVGRVEGDARSTLVQNRMAGQLDAVAIDPPWVGGSAGGPASTNGTSTTLALDDIAVATGAQVLGARLGRRALHAMSDAAVEIGMAALGHAARAEVGAGRTLMELLPLGLRGEDLDSGVARRLSEVSAARSRAAET
ncbi:MAG: TCP-1/cpn60 chaperonin family protein, partial [Myxococcota bacterium]|nr:TCP-1/cpn60 chaperonin family protein [Myxococcota bacterium]